jgi:tRNA dimethylallyltransferase
MLAVLDGTLALERAILDTAAATRRFVRRQRSWFRRDSRMVDIDAAEPGTADRVLVLLSGG